jgi:hypothetical protein
MFLSICDTLTHYGQTKRLLSAERVILTELQKLDPFLESPVADSDFDRFESALFGLFSTNSSSISLQCSFSISERLLKLYSQLKIPPLSGIISLALNLGTSSSICGAGFLCRKIGHKAKSQLPRFVDFLIRQKSHSFACSYALRSCFKAGQTSLSEYLLPSVEFVRKQLLNSSQASLVMELKFLQTIIRFPNAPVSQILESAKTVYSAQKTPIVRNDLSIIVARCAFIPLFPRLERKIREQSEWVINRNQNNNSELDGPLQVLKSIPGLLKHSLSHFLGLLSPAMIGCNTIPLFQFVRFHCPRLVQQLSPLLPGDAKFGLISQICREPISAEQLTLILDLDPDIRAIGEAANNALLLAITPSKQTRHAAVKFFGFIAKSFPYLTLPYLRTALIFLVQPPLTDRPIVDSIRGNGAISYAILKNLPKIEDAILWNRDILVEIPNAIFEKVVFSWRLAEAFNILSLLPDEFCQDSRISDAILLSATYLVTQSMTPLGSRLIKTLLRFRVNHRNDSEGNLLVVSTFTSGLTKFSFSVLASLEILGTSTSAFDAAKLILKKCEGAKNNQRLLAIYVKTVIPSGSNLLLRFALPKELDEELNTLIYNFPRLYKQCQASDKTKLFQLLVHGNKPVNYLFIVAISQQYPGKLPKQLHLVLLPKLESTNLIFLQLNSEILANFVVHFPDTISVIFDFIDQNNEFIGSSILLSAIFTHIILNEHFISRSLSFIEKNMKSQSTVPFALIAMSSFLTTHLMHVAGLGINLTELNVLFDSLNRNIAFQPIVLHLIAECFCSLIELNSEFLTTYSENSVAIITGQILETIRLTPITYSKIVYLRAARSIILFGHSIANRIAPIEFPITLGATTTLQLTACATFSDYLRFNTLKIEGESMTKTLLLILQKTSDSRAGSFLENLSLCCTIDYWISTLRRILLNNSLLDDHVSAIEPNRAVKIAILHSSISILTAISEQSILNTEYLDDFIASICHTIESSEIEIREQAFPVLEKVIKLFENRKSEEGGRLLDLYDIQFTVAVKSGFELNLDISGNFLSEYLSFATQIVSNSTILKGYMNGLNNCRQRTGSYYFLLTKLCIATQKCSDEELEEFQINQLPTLTSVVIQGMQLKRSDWRSFAEFRVLFSNCYSELIPAFVWICSLSSDRPIDVNGLLSYFLIELFSETESWKFSGALNGISMIFESMPNEVNPNLVELVLQASLNFHEHPNFGRVIQSCGRLISLTEISREFILTLALKCNLDIKLFTYLLKNDTKRSLYRFVFSIAIYFIEKSAPSALFYLLFDHSPNVIGFTLEKLLRCNFHTPEIKLEIVEFALLRFEPKNSLPLRLIAKFMVEMLRSGSLELLATILLKQKLVGIALLSEQIAKAIFLLALNDPPNSNSFLQFVQLIMLIIHEDPFRIQFSKAVFRCAIFTILKLGCDPQRGSVVVMTATQLLNEVRVLLGSEFESLFRELSLNDQTAVCGILRTQIGKAALRKKSAQLTTFSDGQRLRKSVDEWQTLEIGGLDDD